MLQRGEDVACCETSISEMRSISSPKNSMRREAVLMLARGVVSTVSPRARSYRGRRSMIVALVLDV